MGKKKDQDLMRQVSEEWIRFDAIFLNPPLWKIRPETVPLTSYTTEDGMLVCFYERGGNGSLKMQCHAGIPNAAAMQVFTALIRLAQCKGWDNDMYVHLIDILEQLHMADSGQNRAMVRDYIHMWRMVEMEYKGYHDGIQWDYLLFRPLEEAVHIPSGRRKGMFKIKFGRTFQKMLSGAGRPESRYIKLDMAIYPRIKGGYALRLYEILLQHLTYRYPDADGMIRWRIRAENLCEWMGVGIPMKELTRNIKSAIEELRRIAGWDVILKAKGRRDPVLEFSTAKRLDEIRRQSAVVPSPPSEEKSPVADLVTCILQEIRKADPDYPQEEEKKWYRALRKLVADGRQASDILKVWKSVHDDGKAGSIYHAAVSLNPSRFSNSYARLLASQRA